VKVLVTGGAGFLGSHLCRLLLKRDYKVICLDNLYTGDLENIREELSNSDFEFVNQDVTKLGVFDVDGIFNLACPASPVHYQIDPVMTFKTSVLGSLNVLELARRTGARVFQASTSEVYGDPTTSPQKESYWGNVNPNGIRACYDEGKRASESIFFDYQRMYNLPIRVARIFNTYGPSMSINDGRVVSNFICQALQNKPISIYGDGSQTRSFCYVDDLINGIVTLFESEYNRTPMNLGNPVPISMQQLAREIILLTNSKSKIKYLPLPSDDPTNRQPDISLAKEILNWEPRINRDIGLSKTIQYFKAKLNTGDL
jgi:UDP-glucuronate decarboxylase